MPRVLLAVLGVAVLVLPVAARAEEPAATTVPTTVPTTGAPPATTSLPATTAPPSTVASAPSTAAETATTVTDEAGYRAALATLSADATGPHTIDLGADITVDDGTDPTYTGTQPLTIDGHGFTLDAFWTSRLLVVDSPTDAAVTLTAITLDHGSSGPGGGGGAVLVRNDSPLTITDSNLWHNSGDTGGGAVQAATTATIERSDFTRNETGGDGGAIDATAPEGRITVRDSSFSNNWAAGEGGAISAVGFGSPSASEGIVRSTFTANEAGQGGALVLGTGVVVANSTFVGNRALTTGGAILGTGRSLSALIYVTVTENIAPEGANLTNRGVDLYVIFSALGEPQDGANCAFPQGAFHITESRVDDSSCPGAREVADLGLGLFGDHGGHTGTRVPLAGSPLIDAIDANFGFPSIPGGCANFQGTGPLDQRGVERPQDGDGRTRTYVYDQTYEVAADCDIGAVEAEAFVAPPSGPVSGGPAFTG